MFEKKRGKRFLASVMALVMLLSLAPIGTLAASGGGGTSQKGTQAVQDVPITWTKSEIAVQGGIAKHLAECLKLKTNISNDVWNSQNGNGATYDLGANSVQRFQGTFKIPSGYSAASSFKLYSAKQAIYEQDGCDYDGIIPINDNIYVFVYPKGTNITASNAVNYLAFYGGNSCGNDFLGKETLAAGSGRYSPDGYYTGQLGRTDIILWTDMMSTDGWFIRANLDNIGTKITELIASGSASEGATFVIDVFAENNSTDNGGGLDRLILSASNPDTAKVVVRYYQDSIKAGNLLATEVAGSEKLAGDTVDIYINEHQPEHYQSGILQDDITTSNGKYTVTEDDVSKGIKYIDILYTPIMYTVTYTDGVDGEEVFEDQVTSDLTYGTATPAFNSTPTRVGYRFTGWNPAVADTVTASVTYTAQWSQDKYTVTYTDGVDGEEVFEDQVTSDLTYGTATPAFNSTPTRTGYTFVGWSPAVADTVTASVTYTAQWNEDTYTVTYTDGVENEEVFEDQVTSDLTYGTATPAFNGTPTRAGYRFTGWNPAVADTVTASVTYTAQWTANSSGGGHRPRPSTPTVDIPDDVPTGLNGKDHYAYIIGYGNNDVRPQNNITRAEVATIFFRLLTDETRTANMTKSNSYNDVKDGDWFCCAVSTLSKMGIIKGYEDGSFKPNAPISRAEFAAIAARFDPDGDKTPATFADVTSHWAKDEISIAANHGWIKGYEDGSFKPDQKITRAETMTLVNRVLNRLPETKDDLHKDMKTWVDNMDETAWYYLAVQEATNSHYFKNKTSTKFEQWTDLRDTRDWSELEK